MKSFHAFVFKTLFDVLRKSQQSSLSFLESSFYYEKKNNLLSSDEWHRIMGTCSLGLWIKGFYGNIDTGRKQMRSIDLKRKKKKWERMFHYDIFSIVDPAL